MGHSLNSRKGEKQDQSFFLHKVQSKQTPLNCIVSDPPARSFYKPPCEFYCCNVFDQLVKFSSITVSGSYIRTEYKKKLPLGEHAGKNSMSYIDPELYVYG